MFDMVNACYSCKCFGAEVNSQTLTLWVGQTIQKYAKWICCNRLQGALPKNSIGLLPLKRK